MYRDLITTVIDYEGTPYRNIKSIRESRSLFDDLAEDVADMLVASIAEASGKPHSSAPLLTRPFDLGTVLTYPFIQENRQQSRFSDGTLFGVWYGSQELETTVHETIYHWRNFLLDAFPSVNRTVRGDRRVFKVQCRGIMIDLRGNEQAWPALVDRSSYQFTQALGHYLHSQNQNGLLVASARCDGVNLAAFTPQILSNPVDVCCLTYSTNPAQGPEVMVERNPGTTWMIVDGSMLV